MVGSRRFARPQMLLAYLGIAVAVAAFAWLLRGLDPERFLASLRQAEPGYLAVLVAAIAVEQVIRAAKWNRLLLPHKRIGVGRLFGAIMAGYLAGFIVPLGAGLLVRSWLIARLDALPLPTVLATTALDRLTDAAAFVAFVGGAVILVGVPGGDARILDTFALAGVASAVLVLGLIAGMAALHAAQARGVTPFGLLLARLPARLGTAMARTVEGFARGAAWPARRRDRLAVVAAAVGIKLVALSHLLWAALAFDLSLPPRAYLFLFVFLGFVMVLAHTARVPGGFLLGGVFALGLLGVAREPALAVMLTLQAASVGVVAVAGTAALWRHGVRLGDLRRTRGIDRRLTPEP